MQTGLNSILFWVWVLGPVGALCFFFLFVLKACLMISGRVA